MKMALAMQPRSTIHTALPLRARAASYLSHSIHRSSSTSSSYYITNNSNTITNTSRVPSNTSHDSYYADLDLGVHIEIIC